MTDMKRHWIASALALVTAAAAGPVQACMMSAPLVLEDVFYADVVVVGRIANYRIVRDPIIRQERRAALSEAIAKHPELLRMVEEGGYMSDYARFDLLVDEVLSGQAGASIAVTWDNSTFGIPESMPAGPVLIALRRPGAPMLPLRAPSVTTLPDPEPGALAVLQAPCSDPFMFESASKRAVKVRNILAKGKRPRRR